MGARKAHFDRTLDALSHVYRRRLLVELLGTTSVPLTSGKTVAANGGDVDLDIVFQQLFHVHLPKLVDVGFIEWDRATDVVRPGERFEEVAPLLRLMVAHTDELPDGWL